MSSDEKKQATAANYDEFLISAEILSVIYWRFHSNSHVIT